VKKKFKAQVPSGHKEDAVEVPFDPAKEWGIPPEPLWPGRRAISSMPQSMALPFESSSVPRPQKFYLLIDAEAEKAAGVSEGVGCKSLWNLVSGDVLDYTPNYGRYVAAWLATSGVQVEVEVGRVGANP
jgi:hypothetical protein